MTTRRSISQFSMVCTVLLSAHSLTAQTNLPRPDPDFKGKVGETYTDSTASYPQPLKAAAG